MKTRNPNVIAAWENKSKYGNTFLEVLYEGLEMDKLPNNGLQARLIFNFGKRIANDTTFQVDYKIGFFVSLADFKALMMALRNNSAKKMNETLIAHFLRTTSEKNALVESGGDTSEADRKLRALLNQKVFEFKQGGSKASVAQRKDGMASARMFSLQPAYFAREKANEVTKDTNSMIFFAEEGAAREKDGLLIPSFNRASKDKDVYKCIRVATSYRDLEGKLAVVESLVDAYLHSLVYTRRFDFENNDRRSC